MSEKIPMITTEDYILYLEPTEFYLFIHCDVFKWNKTIKTKLKYDLDRMQSLVNEDLYAAYISEKTIKFAKLFGFKHYDTFTDAEGRTVPVYWRRIEWVH